MLFIRPRQVLSVRKLSMQEVVGNKMRKVEPAPLSAELRERLRSKLERPARLSSLVGSDLEADGNPERRPVSYR